MPRLWTRSAAFGAVLACAVALCAAAHQVLAAQQPGIVAEATQLRAEPCGGQAGAAACQQPQLALLQRDGLLWKVACRLAGLLSTAACALLAWRYADSLAYLSSRLTGIAASELPAHSIRKRLAYNVDSWFSRSPYSKVLALLYLTLALVLAGALALRAVTQQSLYSAVWETIAGVGIDWTFASLDEAAAHTLYGFAGRAVAVAVSLGGVCVTALLLGIVSEQISHWIEDLKRGRSEVLENGHTLILGWSNKVVTIVDQLCLANMSEGGRPIVILADMEKEEMEEELRNHNIDFLGSHVVCRKGNPHLENDLRRVSVETARAIVALSTCDHADQADARVLRTVLSLMGENDRLLKGGRRGLRGHIVAELADIDNEPLVRMVGTDNCGVYTVTSHDMIGRVMIQCARQPGLAAVWEQLMGFRGDEFYLREWPSLAGRRFADALLMFQHAMPVGVRPLATGEVLLNPADDYVLAPGDELLVLAEDDDTYTAAAQPAAAKPGTCPAWSSSAKPERLLFVGWRRDLDDLIMAMDEFVPPGSEVHLYNDVPVGDREVLLLNGGLNVDSLQNLTVVYKEAMMQGDVVDRKRLEDLHPEQYTSILILSDADNLGTVDSDSRCIAVALLLRDIQSGRLSARATQQQQQQQQQQQLGSATLAGSHPDSGADASSQAAGCGTADSQEDVRHSAASQLAELRSRFSLKGMRARTGRSFTTFNSFSNGSRHGSHGSLASSAHNSFTSVRSGKSGGVGSAKRVQPSASVLRRLRRAKHHTVIIAEILEARAKRIVSELGICEFILSSDIVSMALAMCAENPAVISILAELFTELGNELYVNPVERYLHPDEQLTFYDAILRGRQKGHIVLGYCERDSGKIVLNPKNKGAQFLSRESTEAFVVLAESP